MTTSTLQEAAVARPLPKDAIDEIVRLGADEPEALREPEALLALRPDLPAVRSFARTVRERTYGDFGFDVISSEGLPAAYRRLAYAAIGIEYAAPILRYGLLYAVADRGESYLEKQIPVSMTRADTGMHTDSSARDCVPGVVALLCERPSLDGGMSRIASAVQACEWLALHDPKALELLQKTYIRDVVTPGMDKGLDSLKRNRFPVVSLEPEFQLRYMRYWIEKGQERAGAPLSGDVLAAFDALDAALDRPEFGVTFRLEAGQMLFVDNRRLVHGRDAYGSVPSGGRLLWRMWLDEHHACSA
ncbi:MAG: TauD/TfdA family dioxygenase [Planctomycetota bacterium]